MASKWEKAKRKKGSANVSEKIWGKRPVVENDSTRAVMRNKPLPKEMSTLDRIKVARERARQTMLRKKATVSKWEK